MEKKFLKVMKLVGSGPGSKTKLQKSRTISTLPQAPRCAPVAKGPVPYVINDLNVWSTNSPNVQVTQKQKVELT